MGDKQTGGNLAAVLFKEKDIRIVCYSIIMIGDVIWENPAYGVTKRAGSDQTPRSMRGV